MKIGYEVTLFHKDSIGKIKRLYTPAGRAIILNEDISCFFFETESEALQFIDAMVDKGYRTESVRMFPAFKLSLEESLV